MMSGEDTVTICGICKKVVDPDSSEIVLLEHWQQVGPSIAEADGGVHWQRVMSEHFHTSHMPKLGKEWRRPVDR